MAGLSFTTSGALPMGGTSASTPATNSSSFLGQIGSAVQSNNNRALGLPSSGLSSPASNALNSAQNPVPSTPVKSQTVNNVDGSSTVTAYHAPVTSTSPTGTSAGVLSQAPTAPIAQATIPAYNPNGGASDTVYNNGVPTTYQNGQVVSEGVVAPTTQAAPAPSTPTFPGIVGSLANTSQNGSQNATQATSGLLQAPTQNAEIGQQAQNIAAPYGQQIAKISNYGNALAGSQEGFGLAPVAQGRAQQSQIATAAEVQGEQAAENAALAPIPYELTAQNQGQAGLTDAGSIANTQQSNVQSGLQQAGTLTQPQLGQPGQAYYNPQTGQALGGSAGVPAGIDPSVWAKYQQDYATGNFGAIPSSITGNAQLYGQLQQSAPQGFNYNTALGQAQGQQALGAAQGTGQAAGTAAAAGAAGQTSAGLTQQAAGIQSSANGAEANFTLMQNLAQQGGVNNTNVPVLNTLQQNAAKGLTSSAAVASFQALLQSTRSQYATILGGGTSSVEALQEAQSLIPDNISLGALASLGTNLKSDAANRVAGINQQIQSLSNGSPTVSSGSSTGNTSTSGFGWNG